MIRKEGTFTESLPSLFRKRVVLMLAAASLVLLPSTGYAQNGQVGDNPAAGEPVTGDQSPTDRRYGLVEANGDILRIDREAGSVSFCRKLNGAWRCMPAPLAEQAYQDEIADLSQEVDRLKARIRDLEAQVSAGPEESAPQAGAEPAKPPQTAENKASEGQKAEEAPSADKDKSASRLSDEDEQQLERMMQFSEKAMRRFFGLMKDLQSEFGSN